jgi:GxxExxY protein
VLTGEIITRAIRVHRELGPGLFEAVYRRCLAWEFTQAGLAFDQEVDLAVVYGGVQIAAGYRADMIVEGQVMLELKSVERLLPIHEAQTRTYLCLSGCQVALLINFGSLLLKDGIRRFIP